MSRYRWEIGMGLLLLLILSACRGATQPGLATPEPTDGSFNCSAVAEIPEGECQALVDFYEASGGSGWVDGAGWLETATPCNWTGVSCAGNHVDTLALTFNSLDGQLPETIGNLANLRVLDLHDNALRGPLPPELGRLSALEALDLSANRLDGAIPPSFGGLQALQSLNLSGNALTGTIPDELGQIGALRNLDLSHNRLGGMIPASLANLARLESIRLGDNQLEGPIPFALGELASLSEIDLSFNRLSSTVPSALFEVPIHRLWGNRLEGTIAVEVGEEQTINFMGASFTVGPTLADSVWAELLPEPPALPGPGVMWAPSEHIVFTLVHQDGPQNHSPLGLYLPAEAQLHIYPTAGLNAEVQPAVVALRQLLTEAPDAAGYEGALPEAGAVQPGVTMIPPSNAVQEFRAQAHYLSFADGGGIRYLTQLSQGPVPVSNRELFYTFQGLTTDGTTYVALYYPVTLPMLPDSSQVSEDRFAEMMEDWAGYLAQTVDLLDKQPATAYTPNLEALDTLVSSLSLSGLSPLPAIQTRWPENGEAVDAQPVLQWEAFPDAFAYEVVVIDDDAYPPLVVFEATTAETAATVTPALEPGSYSWRVAAHDGEGRVMAEVNAAFVVNATP